MSRVAKMPIAVPAGADVAISAQAITVKGPLGVLTQALNGQVKVENKEGTLNFEPVGDSREANAMSGTLRALVNNMVTGVTKGFEKKLNLVGVGYKAQAQGDKLNLSLGFSHPVVNHGAQALEVGRRAATRGCNNNDLGIEVDVLYLPAAATKDNALIFAQRSADRQRT